MAAPLDARERVQLCARFDELGPDAPTLCEGWTTFDLAAHLVVRERNPLSGPGILLGERVAPLGRLTERLMAREQERGFGAVVDRVRAGPPPGPMAVPGLREQLNLVEYAVHHEDVRRANGLPVREDVDDLQEALWRSLGRSARLFARRVPRGIGLDLARPGALHPVHAHRGERTATLTGAPLELVLWLLGRRSAAVVELGGDDAAVAAVDAARFGL